MRDLTGAQWRKSTRSSATACVEAALNLTDVVPVRDSKDRGPVLTFSIGQWWAFITNIKAGEFDR